MTLHVGRIDVVLNGTCLDSCEEASLLFYLQENLPRLSGEGIRQMLDVIGTS